MLLYELIQRLEGVGKGNLGANPNGNQVFKHESKTVKIQEPSLDELRGERQQANCEKQRADRATYAEILKRNTTENK